jgi:hypothetical protein
MVKVDSWSVVFENMCGLGVHFWCGVQPARRGVLLSYWLNRLNAANSNPTSWKWGVPIVVLKSRLYFLTRLD